jgi:uncharacterized membrane protein YkoI
MKTCTLIFTAIAALSATVVPVAAIAAEPPLNAGSRSLAETVAHMESTYQGEVTAIQFDASGDKRPHYHVDLRFPQSGIARLDVDAVTHEISAHQILPRGPEWATLSDVTTLIAAQIPGQVTIATLDAAAGVVPHYDVDVRLSNDKTARVKVDAATRAIGWRQPAIVDE